MMPYRTNTSWRPEPPDVSVMRFGEAMRRARRTRRAVSLGVITLLLPATFVVLAILPRGGPTAIRADGQVERAGLFALAPVARYRRLPVHAAFHWPCSCIPVTDEREGMRIRAETGRDCGPWYD
jgi:hypothetical protein